MKTLTCIRNQDIWLQVDNLSLTGWATWQHELEVLDFIDTLVPGTDVFLDLGAAEGRFSLYAAKKGILTLSFEPDKYNFETLEINRQLNQLANLLIHKMAVGAKTGFSCLRVGAPWAGGHHKILEGATRCDIQRGLQFKEIEFREQETVQVVDLDSFLINRRVTAIKVDVDGSEKDFLAGAKQVLARPEVRNLMIELHKLDAGYPEILAELQALGFRVKQETVIEPDHLGRGNLYNIWLVKVIQ